jgi:hypothetical protein
MERRHSVLLTRNRLDRDSCRVLDVEGVHLMGGIASLPMIPDRIAIAFGRTPALGVELLVRFH